MQIQAKSLAPLVKESSGKIILFLSPHFDDVVFSCAGLLHFLHLIDAKPVWATVFSSGVKKPTGFALECQTSKGIPEYLNYMEIRFCEDIECAKFLKASSPIRLGFLEAPYREYTSPDMLFGPIRKEDLIITLPEIEAHLSKLINNLDPNIVFAPLGLGHHVDHRIINKAICAVSKRRKIIFYAESPYILKCSAKALRKLTTNKNAYYYDVQDLELIRTTAYSFYRSQLGFQLKSIGTLKDLSTKSAKRSATLYTCKSKAAELYYI